MSERGAPAGHGAAVRVLVVLAVALIVAVYAEAVFLTRDRWLGGAPTADRTEVVFTALAPDGSPPSLTDIASTPLVTCAQDGRTAYLLGPSVIDSDQVKGASAEHDDSGQWIVDVDFLDAGAATWADFTRANVGTQMAFTLDTGVVSAPQIMEAIPGGRTRITGSFTEAQASELASTIGYGALPLDLTFVSSDTVPGPPGRPSRAAAVAVAAGGVLMAFVVLGAAVYLRTASRRRSESP